MSGKEAFLPGGGKHTDERLERVVQPQAEQLRHLLLAADLRAPLSPVARRLRPGRVGQGDEGPGVARVRPPPGVDVREDREAPRKQRHTAKRIWDRLKAEHDIGGG